MISSRARRRSTRVSSAAGSTVAARLGQRRQRRADLLLRREGQRGEVGPDGLVLPARQQHHLCAAFESAPGPADLLVVRDRRRRRAQVHDEPEVRLVEAHAESAGRDQRLDPVGQQVLLCLARPSGSSRRCTRHGRAPRAQEGGGFVGGGDGQRVDDAGAGQLAELVGEPAEPLVRRRQPDHAQPERVPVQRPAQHQRLAGTGPELLGHVGCYPRVRGGRGRQHRDPGRQLRPAACAAGGSPAGSRGPSPRCSAPRRPPAARSSGSARAVPVPERRVVEPFGADQQHVDLARGHLGVYRLPLLGWPS